MSFKTFLIATASVAVLSSAALASDLPSRKSAAAAPILAVSNAGGLYIGVQGGVAQLSDKHSDLNSWYYNFQNFDQKGTSALIGLKAGYDFQFGNAIVGALVEGSLGQLKAGKEIAPSSPSYDLNSKINFLGSARGKLGFNMGAISVFTTAGLAFSDAKHSYNETDGSGEYYRNSGQRFGYVLGLGGDIAVSRNVSVGLDVSHYIFGKKTYELLNSDGSGTGSFFSQKDNVTSIMLSVNYKF